MKTLLVPAVSALFFAFFAGLIRCSNVAQIFIENRVFFVDADCYSRMTRARMVAEGEGLIIRTHDFENAPEGTTAHTTAPMDWLIAVLGRVIDSGLPLLDAGKSSVLRAQSLDVAGALISPLLGAVTCAFLALWAHRGARLMREKASENSLPLPRVSVAVPLFFAISPVLVHGGALGRPDHHSFLIFALGFALAAECRLAAEVSRRWSVISGAAWGLAIWISLYEPLILFLLVLVAWAVSKPRLLVARDRLVGFAVLATVLMIAFAVEGWPIQFPSLETMPLLVNWHRTIGELSHAGPTTFVRWLGIGAVAAPVLLFLARSRDRRAGPMLILLLLLAALTFWQLRWGYFLALAYAMTLPWQLLVLRKTWIVWIFITASLWPILREWEHRFFPSADAQNQLAVRRQEVVQLRRLCEDLPEMGRGTFLAPWWISPPIAYWTRQNGVAGSSHESLPGIVDSARFYLAEDPSRAAALLRQRGVGWVLVDEPERVIANSAAILGLPAPKSPLARRLADEPQNAPPFLIELPMARRTALAGEAAGFMQAVEPQFYRVYLVRPAAFPNE